MNHRVSQRGALMFLLASASAVSCTQAMDEGGPIGTTEQEVIQFSGSTVWPKTGNIARLSVCFLSNPNPIRNAQGVPLESGYAATQTVRDAVRVAVQNTWERHTNILTTGYGMCVGGENVTIVQSIGLPFAGGTTDRGFPGSGRATMGMSVGAAGTSEAVIKIVTVGTVVHELGHILGLDHEEAKATSSLPAWLQTMPASNTCHPQAGTSTALGLGRYDVNSVMAYCSQGQGGPGTTGFAGGDAGSHVGPWNGMWFNRYPELSGGDVYGIQVLYGRKIQSARYTIAGAGTAGDVGGSAGAGSNCLNAATGNAGTYLGTLPCGATAAGHQAFRYDFATEKFTDLGSPSLRLESYNNNVDMWPDYSGAAVTWRFSNVEIRGLGGMSIGGMASISPPNVGAPYSAQASYMIGTQAYAQVSSTDKRNAVSYTWPYRFKIGTGGDRAIHALNQDGTDSGLCLDVQWGAINTSNTPVWLWACNGGTAQRWSFTGGTGDIRLVDAPGMCLDVEAPAIGGNVDNLPVYDRQNLQIYACNGRLNQQFYFTGQIQSGLATSNKCLTNLDAAPSSGALPVTNATCDAADPRQQWTYRF